jgi:hypothetical protein
VGATGATIKEQDVARRVAEHAAAELTTGDPWLAGDAFPYRLRVARERIYRYRVSTSRSRARRRASCIHRS